MPMCSYLGSYLGLLSDVWLGWVAEGRAYMTDRFLFNKSFDATGVALDSSQDVRIVAGVESRNESSGDTWTTLHFSRLLDTGDCNDRVIKPGQRVYLIWAMGTYS